MIPILYEYDETQFTSEGLGRLDPISCIVTEELNGIYELHMVYPVTGNLFHELTEKRFIYGKVNDAGSRQAFRIYKITKPLNGRIEVFAQHISYDLTGIPIAPYNAQGIVSALRGLEYSANDASKHALVPHSFTTWTDINNTASVFTLPCVRSFRACLGGVKGSILDIFSGSRGVEYEFDMYTVKAYAHRGTDNGVEIRYGKNLSDLTVETTDEAQYSGAIAYWYNADSGEIVYSDVHNVENYSEFSTDKVLILDASSEYENLPTSEELDDYAESYVENNHIGEAKRTLDLSYVALWQTQEYSTMQNIERIKMGDTVHVYYVEYDVMHDFEVIKTEYDMLKERYNYLTLGDQRVSFSGTIQQKIDTSVGNATTAINQRVDGAIGNVMADIDGMTSRLEDSLTAATQKITGVNGGYVVLRTNEDNGQPYEILVMDQPKMDKAINVLRINNEGIGFSQDGVDGTFTSAWTIDGEFDASVIKAGTLDVNSVIADKIDASSLSLSIQNILGMVSKWIYTDADGLHIVGYDDEDKLTEYQTLFTENGMRVLRNQEGGTSSPTLIAEGDTVTAVNLTAQQYLRIDSGETKSRFQEFYSSVDQENMFGCFWEEEES